MPETGGYGMLSSLPAPALVYFSDAGVMALEEMAQGLYSDYCQQSCLKAPIKTRRDRNIHDDLEPRPHDQTSPIAPFIAADNYICRAYG